MSQDIDTLNDIDFDLSDVVTLTKLPSGNSQIFTTGNNRTLNGKDENKCSIKSLETTSTNQELGCDVTTNWEEDNPFLSSDVILDTPPYHNKNLSAGTRPSGAEESTKKTKPKFPGPAGYLSTNSKEFEQNLKGKRTKVIHGNLANMNGLFAWDKALLSLGIQQHWKNSRMNIETVKSSFTPGALYMTVPLFVLGIQRIDYEPVITHDVNCILQDPTGEERGRILKQVINEFGKLIQVGSILVLRRPSVLKWSSSYMVTITKSCLIGIYSPENSEFTQCQELDKTDLVRWLSESIERGEPMNNEDETSLDKNSKVSLFTSTSSCNTSRPNISSPYVSRTPGREAVNNTAYTLLSNPPTPTISRSSSHSKPVHQEFDYRTNNSNATPVRYSNNNISNTVGPFRFKSPSAVFSTARSTPYPQPKTQLHVSSPVKINENANAEDEIVSQLLEGIDTDELFSEDF